MNNENKAEAQETPDYRYDPNQDISINGNSILAIINFLGELVEKETHLFSSFVYPSKVEEKKDDNGHIYQVEYEWKDHNPDSFMWTAVSENGVQPGTTPIGLKASQILSALVSLHEKNIKSGIAKPKTELNDKAVFNA